MSGQLYRHICWKSFHVVEVQIKTRRHSTSSSSEPSQVQDDLEARRGWYLPVYAAVKSTPTDSYREEYSYLSGLLQAVIVGALWLMIGFVEALQKNLAHTCYGQVPVPSAATTGSSTRGMLTQSGLPSCLQPDPLRAPSLPVILSASRSGSASSAALIQYPELSVPPHTPADGLAYIASGYMQIWFQGFADSSQKSMITVKFSGSSPVPQIEIFWSPTVVPSQSPSHTTSPPSCTSIMSHPSPPKMVSHPQPESIVSAPAPP